MSSFKVERIIDDRAIKGRIQYKIRWQGYLSEDDTWENESTLDCTELIEEYNDAKGSYNIHMNYFACNMDPPQLCNIVRDDNTLSRF